MHWVKTESSLIHAERARGDYRAICEKEKMGRNLTISSGLIVALVPAEKPHLQPGLEKINPRFVLLIL